MSTERNYPGVNQPVYQNYPFRKPPLLPPPNDDNHRAVPVVSIALEQTMPIWKVQGDERGNALNCFGCLASC